VKLDNFHILGGFNVTVMRALLNGEIKPIFADRAMVID
jgi:hypothetical protein